MSSLSEMYFKGSYTNVSNSGAPLPSPGEAAAAALCAANHIQNEVLFFKRGRTEEPPRFLPSYCRASFFLISFLCGVCCSLCRSSAPVLTDIPPPHKCTSCGIGGAGVPLLTTHNCFSALVEREHELFSDSSHFDILLYPKEFVFWHCVLCNLVYFPSFFRFCFSGGVCYSSAQLFYFFISLFPPVLSLLLVVSDAVFDCLIAIRIVELEHSCPVPWMERSKSLVVRGGGSVSAGSPPRLRAVCSLLLLLCDTLLLLFF